jgi:UDPglucose--hexose-1-phosphate uridylyltransferase
LVMTIRLEKAVERTAVLDPRRGFEEFAQEVEVRFDPLTGASSRINITRAGRPKQQMSRAEEPVPKNCPFCPENIERETPKFTHGFAPEGRIRCGGATVFPNLFPLSGIHGVCAFTPEHKLDLDRFTEAEVADGLFAAAEFTRRSAAAGARFHFLGWNHLPPAGASILHPHFQIIASSRPTAAVAVYHSASEAYVGREGRSFWADYAEAERGSARFIGGRGGFEWFAPWSPTCGYEVLGICSSQASSLLDLDDGGVRGLAGGIVRLLRGYWKIGVASVNMGVYSWPERGGGFSLNVRLAGRPISGASDKAFLEIFGWETGLPVAPEGYAPLLRREF